MSYPFHGDNKTVTTRKAHRCHWCGQVIPAKSQCNSSSGMGYDDDAPGRFWMHFECAEAHSEVRHDDFYEPERMGRGCGCSIDNDGDEYSHTETCHSAELRERWKHERLDRLHHVTTWLYD